MEKKMKLAQLFNQGGAKQAGPANIRGKGEEWGVKTAG